VSGVRRRAIAELSFQVIAPAKDAAIEQTSTANCPPLETCATPASPGTAAAVNRDVVVPSPSSPAELSPQHLTVFVRQARTREGGTGGYVEGCGDTRHRRREDALARRPVAYVAIAVVAPASKGAVGEQPAHTPPEPAEICPRPR